jgi:hypothetical protein
MFNLRSAVDPTIGEFAQVRILTGAFVGSRIPEEGLSPRQFKACKIGRKSLALLMLFIPPMKTKQIPDDFRDWIESRTFEIGAEIAPLPGPPLDCLKRILVPKLAGGSTIGESRPLAGGSEVALEPARAKQVG